MRQAGHRLSHDILHHQAPGYRRGANLAEMVQEGEEREQEATLHLVDGRALGQEVRDDDHSQVWSGGIQTKSCSRE